MGASAGGQVTQEHRPLRHRRTGPLAAAEGGGHQALGLADRQATPETVPVPSKMTSAWRRSM